jgi:hypothetical protein
LKSRAGQGGAAGEGRREAGDAGGGGLEGAYDVHVDRVKGTCLFPTCGLLLAFRTV